MEVDVVVLEKNDHLARSTGIMGEIIYMIQIYI